MHHAIEVSDGFNVNFFSLANMYAVSLCAPSEE